MEIRLPLMLALRQHSRTMTVSRSGVSKFRFRKYFLGLLFVLSSFGAWAQTTKTLPGDYANFAAAIADINANFPTGGVTVNVAAGYSETVATVLPAITAQGTTANQIIFQKSGSGANPVIKPTGTTGVNDAGITISGGDYITFDGIDINIATSNALEYGYLVRNASATNGALNNTIKNASITLNKTNTSSMAVLQSSIATPGGGITPTNLTGTNQNNSYTGLTIQNAYSGILLVGGSATLADNNNTVSNNIVGGASTGDLGGGTTITFGIKASLQSNVTISNNQVRNITNTTGAIDGIFLDLGLGTATINNNQIGSLAISSTTATTNIAGMRINLNNTSGNSTKVYNNFVYGLTHGFTGTATTTRRIVGIFLQSNGTGSGNTHEVSFNSVRIETASSFTASSSALEIGTSGGPVMLVRNNILANFSGAQSGAAKHYAWATTAAASIGASGSVSNYNDLYIANATNGFIGFTNSTDRATLANWQTATSQDPNSLSVDPVFVSATDLHSQPTSTLDGQGLVIAGITTDIDGQTRNSGVRPSGPDIGGDEFSPVTGVDVGVAALISPASSKNCYTNSETVTVLVQNLSTTPLVLSSTQQLTVSGTITGPGSTTITLTPQTISTGTIAGNGTLAVDFTGIDLSATGTYTFNISATATGDGDATNDALPSTPSGLNTRTVQALSAGTASASSTSLCGTTSTTTLSLTGNTGGTFVWQSSTDNLTFTDISGATSSPFTTPALAQTTYFRALATCNGNSVPSNTVTVIVTNPTITTINNPVNRCGAGSVTLTSSSTPGSTPYYYTSATGGTAVASGPSATVNVTSSTTYYVAARDNGSTIYTAGLSSNVGNGTYNATPLTDYPLAFNLATSGTLTSVDVYPSASGSLTVTVYNVPTGNPGANGSAAGSVTVTIASAQVNTLVTVPLNLPLAAGSYRITTPSASVGRISTYAGTYPLTNGPISVVGSYNASNSSSYTSGVYNGFFNLKFTSNCESARTAINITVTPAPALTPATASQTVCPNSSTTIAFSGYPDLSVSPAATAVVNGQDITFTPTTTTTYTVTGNDPVSGCSNTTSVTLTVTSLAGGTATTNASSFCGATATPVLSLTGNNGATNGFVWQQSATGLAGSFTDISGSANQSPFTAPAITATTYYQAVSSCGVNTANSNILTITISDPKVVATNSPVTRCGPGTVTLTAASSASSTIRWYDSNTSTTALATGNTYTPTVTTSHQFFAAAVEGAETVGRPTPGSASNAIANSLGLVFNAANAFNLNSVEVYPAGSAVTITIQVQNSSGNLISGLTTNYNLPAGTGTTPVTIPLNFTIPAGTGMRLIATSTQPLVREQSIGGFPYNSTNGTVSITGGYNGTSTTSTTYFYFYNWQISGPCQSSRTAVQVNVTTPPTLTFTGNTTICNGSNTVLTFNPSTYTVLTVNPAAGATVNGNEITFNPTSSTTYTVTGNDGAGANGCTATATATITVNPKPDAPTLTPATPGSICVGGSVVVSAAVNTTKIVLDENFNASPSGWTIAEKSTRGGLNPGTLLRFARPSVPYTYGSLLTNYSIDGTRFIIANADTGGNNSVTRTRLISPTFSLANLTSASLTFQQNFNFFTAGDSANVDISTDGGTTWTLNILEQRTADVGSNAAPANTVVNLNAYTGQSNLKIRFRYKSTWGYYWALDNVQIKGQLETPTYAVTPASGATVNGSNITFNPTTTSTYQVTATFPSSPNCPSPATPITIIVNDLPTVALTNNGPVCANTAGTVLGTLTGTAPFSITYTTDGTNPQTITANNNQFTIPTGILTANTTFAISALSDANCSATELATATTTVVVNPEPTVMLNNSGPVCGSASATITGNLTGTAPFTITYTTNGGNPQTLTANSNQFTFASGALTGNATYTISALSDAKCSATTLGTSASTTVVANPLPTVALSNNGPVCVNSPATLTGTLTGTAPFSVTYTTDGTNPQTITTASNQFTITTGSLAANTTFEVTAVTDANCSSGTFGPDATTTVAVNARPTVVLTNDGPVCPGFAATITGNLTGTAPFIITYTTDGANPQTIMENSNQFFIQTNGLTANTVIAITDLSDANCNATDLTTATSTVTVNPEPTVTLSNNGPVCNGTAGTVTGTLTGTAPFIINYSVNGGAPQTITTNTNQFTIPTAALTADATYTITDLIDAICSASSYPVATTTVAVYPTPTVVLSNNGPICGNSTATISGTLTGTAPFSLTYTVNNVNPITITSATNSFSFTSAALTASTTFRVISLSDANCTTFPATATTRVIVNPEPTVTLSNNGPVCGSGSAIVSGTLTGTAPFSITYTTNGTNPQTIISNTTTFTITTATLTTNATIAITALTDANCVATSFPATTATTVVVTDVTTWTGNVNTNWFIAGNWTACLPSSTVSAVIPAGRTNYPVITTGTPTVKTLTIESGAKLTQNNGNLMIYGNLINHTAAANITLTNGAVVMASSTAQTIGGSQPLSFFNLTVNKPAEDLSCALDQTVRNALTLTSGKINTGSFKVTLGANANIFETDENYLLGNLETTRFLNATGTYTFGSMGYEMVIASNVNSQFFPGNTVLRRVTGTRFSINASSATIGRYFQVQANNNNVKVDINFRYLAPELGVQSGPALKLYSSINSGTTWTVRSGSSATTATKMVESGNPGVQAINMWWSASDGQTPLPVELVSFTAVKRENNALLNWSTASEKDSKGFEVEVSTNGREFRQIGFVESRNGSTMQYYAFTDSENGKYGMRYYRLKQVDLNGDFTYSDVKALQFGNRNQLVDVYPNPFSSEVNLAIQALSAETATVTITDMVGKTVLVKQVKVEAGANKIKLQPAQSLPAGAYIISIDLGGERFTNKLLKQY